MMTAGQIAERLGGELIGDASIEITGLAGLPEAGDGDISFLANVKYTSKVKSSNAAVVLVPQEWDGQATATVIKVKNVDLAFAHVGGWFAPEPIRMPPGVHETAVIADDVELGEDVAIGPNVVLERGAKVGDRTQVWANSYIGFGSTIGKDGNIAPNVSIRNDVTIGDRVIIHSGTAIGGDGFGFVPVFEDGKLRVEKIPHTGNVVIGDDVELGTNVAVDRARFGTTRLGNMVKIDNLVQIAHNVTIGDCSGCAAQVGLAGSAHLGSGVMIWGQAAVSGHILLGDGCVVGGQAGVTKSYPAGTYVSGYPALPHAKASRNHANVMRLPALKKRVAELEKRLEELEKKGDSGE